MRNIHCYAEILKKTMPVQLGGFGGSMPEGDFKNLFVAFDMYEEVEIERARTLILKAADGFLDNINNDLVLRPLLNHFPYTFKDVQVDLSFITKSGGFVVNNHIAHVALIRGNFFYARYNEKTEMLETIQKESYLEALEKVKQKNEENIPAPASPS
jgi:hypothetical protein